MNGFPGKRPVTPADLFRFAKPGDPQLSPDGQRLAYVLQRLDREKNRSLSGLRLVDLGTGEDRQLTSMGTDRAPRWSPDGSRLAFLSSRGDKSQIWIWEREGGEAWPLTTELPVDGPPVWSPDGRKLAFVAREASQTRSWLPYAGAPEHDGQRAYDNAIKQIFGDAVPTAREADAPAESIGVKVVGDIYYRLDGVGFLGDVNKQVFTVDVPERPPQDQYDCIPAQPVTQLTWGPFDHDGPSWSPDGGYLVVSARREPFEVEAPFRQDLWLIDVATGDLTLFYQSPGPASGPLWSPDGRWVAFTGHDGRYRGSTTTGLWLLPVPTALPLAAPLSQEAAWQLTRELDRPVGTSIWSDVANQTTTSHLWSGAGEAIFFTAADRGAVQLYAARLFPGQTSRLDVVVGGRRNVNGFTVAASGASVVQFGDDTRADELYALDPDGELRPLTHHNAALMAELYIAPSEQLRFTGPDDWEIEGWLLKPYGYEEGKRYSLVVAVHGGPHSQYGYSILLWLQVLASAGHAVLLTNPRGSQSYGQEFARAVVGDWGGRDLQDILAGVDEVIARGVADPQRVGITGTSYGGFMSCWAISQTQRFRAAMPGNVLSNLHSFYGTSDVGFSLGDHHAGGKPWEPEPLLARSAVCFAHQVTTPVLLMHCEEDMRCPIGQTEEFFVALRRQGKEAVMVRYPGEYHGLRKPLHWLDRNRRALAWFGHHLAP